MTYQTEKMILFTVVVGAVDSDRAIALREISEGNDARSCVVKMVMDGGDGINSELIDLVDQISFYYDEMNKRGVFMGTIPAVKVEKDSHGIMNGKPLVVKIVKATGIENAEINYSWVLVGLDSLEKGHGDLIIKQSTGSVGGNLD